MAHRVTALYAMLMACRQAPPAGDPVEVPPSDTGGTLPDSETHSEPGTPPDTDDPGPADSGSPCPPVGTQRRLLGELDLGVDAWLTVDGLTGSLFGYSVAGAGDLTGDGRAEVAAFTLFEEQGTDQGGIYLLPSPLAPGTLDARAGGVRLVDSNPGLGSDYWFNAIYGAMTTLDDRNGDGLSEFAIGSYWHHLSGPFLAGTGAVFVLGSPLTAAPGDALPVDPGLVVIGAVEAYHFGTALAAGDLDGDGAQDLAVSAVGSEDADGGFRGEVFLFPSSALVGTIDEFSASARIYGDNSFPLSDGGPVTMGDQVLSADLDADGQADLVVSSPSSWVDGTEGAGEVYVFQGPILGDTATSDAMGTLRDTVEDANLGVIATAVGDTDGDGYHEIGLSTTGLPALNGNVWIVDGPVVGEQFVADRADTHFYGLADGDQVASPGPVGDVDQDGLDDLGLGATGVNGDSRGAVMLYYGPLPTGSVPMNVSPDAVIWGEAGGGWPIAIQGVGDVDGDCQPDLAVGARFSDAVYLLRGGTL